MNMELHKNKLILLAILGLVMLQLYSCKGKKKAMATPETILDEEEVLHKLENSRFEFESLSFRFKGKYEQEGRTLPVGGQIRMKKDSLIWISISPILGIEIARVLINPHEIKYYNKLEKAAFEKEFSYLKKQFHPLLDFSLLQSVLLGNDFENYENEHFVFHQTNQDFVLRSENRKHKYSMQSIPFQEIKLGKNIDKIHEIIVGERKGNYIHLQYTDFEELESQKIAKHILLELFSSQDISSDIELSRLQWNTSLRFPFQIPKHYQIIKP